MSIKSTRGTDFQQLTATSDVQVATLPNSIKHLMVRTLSTDGVRISINDSPSDLSATKGILITKDTPLDLTNHIIHAISYIRETGAAADVVFEIIGMYHERNTVNMSED